jgi:hypothetical protein
MKIRERSWPVFALQVLMALLCGNVANAFPIRVFADTQLQVEPRLAPDRSSLLLALHAHDDQGRALVRSDIFLDVRIQGGLAERVSVATDSNGDALYTLPLRREMNAVDVSAHYAGNEDYIAHQTHIHVNLDAPYVTVDVAVPGGGVELGSEPWMFYVTLRVGEVVSFQAQGQGVEIRERDTVIARGVTDLSGRANLRVETSTVRVPGVHRVRAFTLIEGERVEGPEHDFLVRARTVISLVRATSADDNEGHVGLRGVLVTREGEPVRSASVRIVRGTQTLAGARTDERGGFLVRMGSEVLAEHGVVVHAVFEPTEPWYVASESDGVQLTPPAPVAIHWGWALVPALAALVAVLATRVRGRIDREIPVVVAHEKTAFEDRIEHSATPASQGLRVRFSVVDRASSMDVLNPSVRRAGETEWTVITNQSLVVQPARKIEFEIGAKGYATRKVVGEFSRPGEYLVRVQLRTWREELFERARPWLRRVGGNGPMPTLREALKTRAETPAAMEFVTLIEEGCYAPPDPSEHEVSRADELSSLFDTPPTLRRD